MRNAGWPKAIVFDLYGTILDVGGLAQTVGRLLPNAPAQELVATWRQKQLEYSWLRTMTGHHADFWQVTGDALENAAARLSVSLDGSSREGLMEGWSSLRPYPDVGGGLDALPDVPLAILSNGSPRMLDDVLRGTGLRERFRHVISVEDAGVFKPDPRVYRLPELRLDLSRESMLFVSANDWDARGATLAGWRVVRVDRVGAPSERLPGAPEACVTDLADLADWLRRG